MQEDLIEEQEVEESDESDELVEECDLSERALEKL